VSWKRSGSAVVCVFAVLAALAAPAALALTASGCSLLAGLGEHELRPGGGGAGGTDAATGAGGDVGTGTGPANGEPVVLAEQGDMLPHALLLDGDKDSDGAFETVYWVTERAGSRAVWSMPTAGGAEPTKLVPLPDPFGRSPSKVEIGIAVDIDRLYWTQAIGEGNCNTGDSTYGKDKVLSIPKAGGTATDIEVVWEDCPNRAPSSIAVDGKYVFFSLTRDHRIPRVRKAFGDVVVLAEHEYDPYDIATDQTHVYWIARSGNSGGEAWIRASSKEGLTKIELFTTNGEVDRLPNALAVDDAHVYWADNGMVRRVDKMGVDGKIRDLVNGSGAISAIALDDSHVYWTNATAGLVLRAPKEGDNIKPEVLATDQSDPEAIAVDSVSIYWTNLVRGDLVKLRKPAP